MEETTMKKSISIVPLIVLALFLTFGGAYAQQTGPGGAADQGSAAQQGGWYCPHCQGMGRGMMGQQGMMMNCPMMGSQGGMMQHGTGQGQQGKPVTAEQAKTLVENYVKSMNNPNLKVGKVAEEKDKDYFVAEILTKDGSLADKIQVNKNTGWFRSAYAQ
jgi:hypothetical protein